MKKNIILTVLAVGVAGTVLVKVAEHMFGMTNVFLFAAAVTFVVGAIIVPFIQMRKDLKQ
jgi:hypothetical protein